MMAHIRSSWAAVAVGGLAMLSQSSPVPAKPAARVPPAARVSVNPNRFQLAVPLRKSINDLTAAELASLRKGFAQMIAWNGAPHGSANFKRSLLYWANMHAYIGSGCSPASGINNPGMSGLSVQSKSTPDENATWCTCQHGTIQFLTWHRMYLYYFEKVLQAAAGDPKLRLPYWDYEKDGHIPAAYRSPTYVLNGSTVPNPLYVANRQAQLNAGTAALTAAVVATSGAMPKTSYSPFNSAIEQTPHGSVHCATGVGGCPTGYMGYVPSAGNDPIFYSHHANIDRLYECWLKVSPAQRLPSGSTLTASFSFIDGAGTLVTRVVADMLTTQQLNYGYTAGAGCPLLRIPHLPILESVPWRVIPLLGPTRIEPRVMKIPVRIAPETEAAAGANKPPKVNQANLVLEGVASDEAPGAMFEVALEDSNGKRVTVGVLNFFTETAPRHDGMAMANDSGRKAFDATAALQALGTASPKLVIQPTSGVTGSGIEESVLAVNPRANLRFSSATLEVR
jgi:hypothetical protein